MKAAEAVAALLVDRHSVFKLKDVEAGRVSVLRFHRVSLSSSGDCCCHAPIIYTYRYRVKDNLYIIPKISGIGRKAAFPAVWRCCRPASIGRVGVVRGVFVRGGPWVAPPQLMDHNIQTARRPLLAPDYLQRIDLAVVVVYSCVFERVQRGLQ